MAAALFVPRYAARQRNDGAALAAPHLRHHLDRLALFFQPGPDAGDEEVRSRAENQNLSGADVRRDGMVSLLGVRDRAGWLALFLDSSVRGRETCGRSFADWQVVWLVAAGVARRVYIHLRAAAPREGNLRQRVVPSRGRFYCGDCRLLAGARSEWRAQRFQCPPRHQRWWRTRTHHAAEYLGSGLAHTETPDCLDARGCQSGHAHARRNGTPHALELSHRSNFVLAVLSDALLHGRRQPLPVSQHHRAINRAEGDHVRRKKLYRADN